MRLLLFTLVVNLYNVFGQHPNFDSLIQKDADSALTYYETLNTCQDCEEYKVKALSSIGLHYYLKRDYDTALTLYNRALVDSEQFPQLQPNLYKRKADLYNRKSQYDTSLMILRRGIKLAKSLKQFHQLGTMYNSYGISSRRMSRLDSSLIYYDLAMKAYQDCEKAKEKTPKELIRNYANIYKNKGIIYATLSIDDLALENFLKAISMEEKGNLQEQLAKSYLNIGVFYQNIKNFEKFKEVIHKAMFINDSLGVMVGLALCHNNLGNYYIKYTDQTDSAGYHFNKALAFARTSKNKYYQALALQNLGNYHLDMGRYDSAEVFTNESIAIREMIGDEIGKANTAINLARLKIAQNQPGAEVILLESMNTYQQKGVAQGLIDTYTTLIDYYEKSLKYEEANNYYQLLGTLKDSLNKEELFSKVSNLEIKNEVERYQEELDSQAILLLQNKKINYLLSVGIFLFVLVVVGMIYAYTKLKSYSAALEEKNHRIDTLMRELHHRVKNNLQVISSLLGLQSMSIKDEKAKKLVEEGKSRVRAMSLIHQNLYKEANSTTIDSKQYIEQMVNELARSYGMENKVKLHIDVPNTNMDVDTSLPLGLIINELVSNAFKYAYKDIENPILELKLITDQSNGQLMIADNGKGVSEVLESSQSFGLKLVRMLTDQLNGHLSIDQKEGLRYELTFVM